MRVGPQIIDGKSGLAKIDDLLVTADLTRMKAKVSFILFSLFHTHRCLLGLFQKHIRVSTSPHQLPILITHVPSVCLGVVRGARRVGERLPGVARVHGCDDGDDTHAIDLHELRVCLVSELGLLCALK